MASETSRPSRWEGTPQAELNSTMARVREGLLAKSVAKAHARAAELGLTLSDDQAREAGVRILKQEQRDRAAQARILAENARILKKGRDDNTWALRQAASYAAILHTFDPATPLADQLNIAGMALQDEFNAPDAFSRPRAIRRLQALVDAVKAQVRARSDVLDASLVEQPDWDSLPTLDDSAAEDGVAPWADR